MTVTETTTPITATEADKALKAKHAAMWASGDYSRVADEIVGSLGASAGRVRWTCSRASRSSTSPPAPARRPCPPLGAARR